MAISAAPFGTALAVGFGAANALLDKLTQPKANISPKQSGFKDSVNTVLFWNFNAVLF